MDLKAYIAEHLTHTKNELAQAIELAHKCQGAIYVLEHLLEVAEKTVAATDPEGQSHAS